MSTAPTWHRPASDLEVVWGPAWTLLVLLSGFITLLALMFAVASRNDPAMLSNIFGVLAASSGAIAITCAGWAVHRQARVQRIWANRLAPFSAARRVARTVGQGMGWAWFAAALPMLLLGAAPELGRAAVAGATLLALLMLITATWACAWQGRVPLWGLAPAALVTATVLIWRPHAVWTHWLEAGWLVQVISGLASAAVMPWVLAARGGAGAVVPALAWAALQQRLARGWRRGYRRVTDNGEPSPSNGVIAGLWYPITGGLNLGTFEAGAGWVPFHLTLTGGLTAVIFLVLAFNSVVSTDLHWRRWLAPGTHRRQGLGLRVLRQSAMAHCRVALCLTVVVLVAAALWPWGERASNLARSLETLAAIGLYWMVALPAAVWLRGLKASAGRRLACATGLVAVWLAVSALLVWAGVEQRGTLLLCLVGLSGLALLPAIRSVWQHRDLADFMPRKIHSPEADA
jgi:hypothetical protein